MASLTAAMQHIRQTRRQLDESQSRNFDRYRLEYERILEAIEELTSESAFGDLSEWMVQTTTERKRLPTSDESRRGP